MNVSLITADALQRSISGKEWERIAHLTTRIKSPIIPTRKEKSEWKGYLYNALMFLATERPELRPRKKDSLYVLLESFLYWADEYNDGYFSERDDADTDRYSAWLVQEYEKMMGAYK